METLSAETRNEIYEKLWTRMPRLNTVPATSFRIDDFISLIKGLPIIYNRLDKHNKQEYADTWDRLEAILKTPKKFLMMKWKGLRDNFRVELKKEYFSPPENRYISKWVHYKKLSFLREQVLVTLDQKLDSDSHDELHQIMKFVQNASQDVPPTGESAANEEHSYANSDDIDPREFLKIKKEQEEPPDEDDDDDLASDDAEFSFRHFQEPDHEPPKPNPLPEITITPKLVSSPMNLQKRKRSSTSSHDSIALPPKMLARTSGGIPHDDDYHFLMSIHPYLKQLPLPVKLKVRLQMQQVLFNELMKQTPIADEED